MASLPRHIREIFAGRRGLGVSLLALFCFLMISARHYAPCENIFEVGPFRPEHRTKEDVAVCFTGDVRTGQYPSVFLRLRKNLLEPLKRFGDVEVLTITETALTNRTYPFLFKAFEPYLKGSQKFFYRPIVNCSNVWSLHYRASRQLQECIPAILKREHERGKRFTWIVRARFDLFWFDPLETRVAFNSSRVHIKDYAGFDDRFAIIPRRYMEIYFNLINSWCCNWVQNAGMNHPRRGRITLENYQVKNLLFDHRIQITKWPFPFTISREIPRMKREIARGLMGKHLYQSKCPGTCKVYVDCWTYLPSNLPRSLYKKCTDPIADVEQPPQNASLRVFSTSNPDVFMQTNLSKFILYFKKRVKVEDQCQPPG